MPTTTSPPRLPGRLRRALLPVPLLAALLAPPALLLSPLAGAASSAGPAPAAATPHPASATCVAWPLPDGEPSFTRVAVLLVGVIAIARGVYAVFAADRNRGAPVAGSF